MCGVCVYSLVVVGDPGVVVVGVVVCGMVVDSGGSDVCGYFYSVL